jgi:hypothetical protein
MGVLLKGEGLTKEELSKKLPCFGTNVPSLQILQLLLKRMSTKPRI